MRPDGVIPGPAPVEVFLIRNNEMAVAVGSVAAYPNGFEFTVHARLRNRQFVWGKSPLDSLADPRTRGNLNRPSGWASGMPMAAEPGPAATALYLLIEPMASTWSCSKLGPVVPSANGTVASGFIRFRQAARSPSSHLGCCCMRWPRLVQNWIVR